MTPSNKLSKLERLLSELADEGASPDAYSQIELLLLDDPELQECYLRWMDTHVLLGIDKGAIDLKRLRTPYNDLGVGVATTAAPDSTSSGRNVLPWWGMLAIAASLLFAAFVARPWVSSEHSAVASTEVPIMPEGAAGAAAADNTPFNGKIPVITRASRQGPFFASGDAGVGVGVSGVTSAQSDRPGKVSIKTAGGRAVEGYLLEVKPGDSVDITAASDARAHNALTVTELDATGAPLQWVVAFENFASSQSDPMQSPRTRGKLGTWSTCNRTSSSQYYLLTGIYRLAATEPRTSDDKQSEWQLCDSLKMIDDRGVILLGWEDFNGRLNEPGREVVYDRDYDDTFALIRHRRKGEASLPRGSGLVVSSSKSQPGGAPHSDGMHRYRFTLPPGECAVLSALRDASQPNALYLIDRSSQAVLWASHSDGGPQRSLGAAYLENNSREPVELELIAEYQPWALSPGTAGESPVEAWSSAKYQVTSDFLGGLAVGFDDDGGDDDFDDVVAVILSTPRVHNPPIDILGRL